MSGCKWNCLTPYFGDWHTVVLRWLFHEELIRLLTFFITQFLYTMSQKVSRKLLYAYLRQRRRLYVTYLRQILTDFQSFFNRTFCGKFVITCLLNIPPLLNLLSQSFVIWECLFQRWNHTSELTQVIKHAQLSECGLWIELLYRSVCAAKVKIANVTRNYAIFGFVFHNIT